jgi:hypothetical protein
MILEKEGYAGNIKVKNIIIPYVNPVWCEYYEDGIDIVSVTPVSNSQTMGAVSIGGTDSSTVGDTRRCKIHFPSSTAPSYGVAAVILYRDR